MDYQSREDALAAARGELSHVEPGLNVWTGKAVPLDVKAISEQTADAGIVLDQLESNLYDAFGGEVDVEITATDDQRAELEAMIAVALEAWLVKHALLPKLYNIEQMVRHKVVGFVEDDAGNAGELILEGDPHEPPTEAK